MVLGTLPFCRHILLYLVYLEERDAAPTKWALRAHLGCVLGEPFGGGVQSFVQYGTSGDTVQTNVPVARRTFTVFCVKFNTARRIIFFVIAVASSPIFGHKSPQAAEQIVVSLWTLAEISWISPWHWQSLRNHSMDEFYRKSKRDNLHHLILWLPVFNSRTLHMSVGGSFRQPGCFSSAYTIVARIYL